MILSISQTGEYKSNIFPHKWRGKHEVLPKDKFTQHDAFEVSSELLTAEFVREHVGHAAKRAVLLDLKQPHSQLLALHGYKGLHIFDKT